MKIKSERDFAAGLVFVVVGVAFAIASLDHPMGRICLEGDACASSFVARFAYASADPGAGFVSLGLGVLLAALGAALLFKSLAIEIADAAATGLVAWRPVAFTLLAVVAFGVLLRSLGIVGASALAAAIASRGSTPQRWSDTLWQSVFVAVAAALFFARGWPIAAVAVWPWFLR